MDLPSNSDKIKKPPVTEDRKVEQVTSEPAQLRKKSLGKKFKETFIGGDAKEAGKYAVLQVLVPAAKDALADALTQGFEKVIFGESRGGPRRRSPTGGNGGYVAYNRMSQGGNPRSMSSRARATHDFGEIILPTRQDCEDVLDRLFDIAGKYESVTVADLYDLVGIRSTSVDKTWGWTDLRGTQIAKVRSGYMLDISDPEEL